MVDTAGFSYYQKAAKYARIYLQNATILGFIGYKREITRVFQPLIQIIAYIWSFSQYDHFPGTDYPH